MKIIEKLKNKTTIAGKQISVFMIMFVLMASIGTAALLTSYGTITGTADVDQAVEVTGDLIYIIGDSPAQAGNTYLDGPFTVKNHAESSATVMLSTRCKSDSIGYDDGTQTNMSIDWFLVDGMGSQNTSCDGIVTSYFGTLNLSKKTVCSEGDTTLGCWQVIEEPITITYTLVDDTFVINEEPPTDYVFVYAMDQENRFANYATVIRVEDVDESLPYVGDWNADASPDYCDSNNGFDDYTHCVGAKIWAVPETAIGDCDEDNVCELTWANMANYYYETDLITYTKGTDNKIDLLANGGGFDFVVENQLDVALKPDVYTLTTNITPA